MTEQSAPRPPILGPSAAHRAHAEQAAAAQDYDSAVRERFRAVTRGLEQTGVLEVRRARTARQTADAAGARLPDDAAGLAESVTVFDDVVYGTRPATKEEYRLLVGVDHYALAPPPRPDPREVGAAGPKAGRVRPEIPDLLRRPKFWAIAAAAVAILLLLLFMPHGCAVNAPPHPPVTHSPSVPPHVPSEPPALPDDKSIFDRWPKPVAFGGSQLLIAGVVLAIWRGRRRGALVGEPRPVDVPANELVDGRARLYRRSRDYPYIAAGFRMEALRRIRPLVGLAAEASQAHTVVVIAARTGGSPADVMSALYGPVDDEAALAVVVAQLDWMEAEVAAR